jgi:hypothetical protein
MYDEGFALLSVEAAADAPALERLRMALRVLGRFLREQRPFVARVWSDASQGQPVAQDFIRANAPRHLALLVGLMAQAEAEGALRAMPALQRFVFVMGAVAAPTFIAPVVAGLGLGGALSPDQVDAQVMSDAAIAARVDLVLDALSLARGTVAQRARPAARTEAKHG